MGRMNVICDFLKKFYSVFFVIDIDGKQVYPGISCDCAHYVKTAVQPSPVTELELFS